MTPASTEEDGVVPDEILGIPLHPLLVHVTVVVVPLAALGTVLIALVPGWRRTYGWLVVTFSAVAVIAVPLTTWSGNRLFESLQLGGPALETVLDHQQQGQRVIWAAAPLLALNLATMLALLAGWRKRWVSLAAWLAVVPAIVATVLVVLTGHLGSQAVWNPGG